MRKTATMRKIAFPAKSDSVTLLGPMMNDQSSRVVRFLIWTSLTGVGFATFVSRLTWDNIVAIMASR
jgi:hypothetical protein